MEKYGANLILLYFHTPKSASYNVSIHEKRHISDKIRPMMSDLSNWMLPLLPHILGRSQPRNALERRYEIGAAFEAHITPD